jgi:hypothetical protein
MPCPTVNHTIVAKHLVTVYYVLDYSHVMLSSKSQIHKHKRVTAGGWLVDDSFHSAALLKQVRRQLVEAISWW